jgi:uncharacterized protein (TIGR02301 family)
MKPLISRFYLIAVLLVSAPVVSTSALAVDPLYEPQLERLSEVMGSLYFLTPLCAPGGKDWRVEMSELIALDTPDDDRKQRLAGAFNNGYQAYARLYRECTDSAHTAMTKLLVEAEQTARDIHAHYAE